MYFYEKLLNENAATTNNKPDLLAIHRRALNKVYSSIVATQETTKPTATVYGAKYYYENNSDTDNGIEIIKGSNYGGAFTYTETQALPAYDDAATYNTGDEFRINGYAIEVLSDGWQGTPITTVEEGEALIFDNIVTNDLRIMTDGSTATQWDDPNREIQETKFTLERWNCEVKTRKFKTQYTIELMQDLENSELDSDGIIEDLFSSVSAEEINIDVISKLNVIAKREGAVDVSALNEFDAAKKLLSEISTAGANISKDSTFKPTFVVASPKVVGLLQSLSGVKSEQDGSGQPKYVIESSGMELIVDRYALGDYFTIGAKYEGEGADIVAPLYFAPYNYDGSGMQQFAKGLHPKSLQPIIVGTARYGLCTSPYANESEVGTNVIDGESWSELKGMSELARFKQVIL